jgi:ElaB/YqjD/DUF883 family membrane-anchored ribosome-binding protein
MVEFRPMANKDDMAKTMEKSAQRVEDTGAKVTGKVADKMRNKADNIKNVDVNQYRDNIMDTMDDFRAEVDKNMDHVKSNIRDRPFESVAIAAGAGLILGMTLALMNRRAVRRSMRNEV